MMDRKIMLFENICPFVRHVHLFEIEPGIYPNPVKAYDCRLIYIYDNKGYMIVDNVRYDVSKGDLLLWKPGVEYQIFSECSDYLIIFGVNFDFTQSQSKSSYPIPPEKTKSFDEKKITEHVSFKDADEMNAPVYLQNMQIVESTLIEMTNEYNTRKKYYFHKVNGLFQAVLGDIARITSLSGKFPDAVTETVDLVLKFIQNNYNQPLTNSDIGRKLNYHANYINKLVVQHTGTSLHQYLINYRISKAIYMMQTTDMTISDIALAVGYKDVNYFSKAFKVRVGKSPRDYKSHSSSPV